MVQMSDVPAIRRRWEMAGSPPCDHTDLDREYYLGAQGDDLVCLGCGVVFPSRQAAERAAAARSGDEE